MRPPLHIKQVYVGPILLHMPEEAYRSCFDDIEWAHIQTQRHPDRRAERLFGRWWIAQTLYALSSVTNRRHRHSFDPQLRCRNRGCPFVVTLAHAAGWCFAVIAHVHARYLGRIGIGCDIECRDRLHSMQHGIWHPHDRIVPSRRKVLWCIKEACLKALPPTPNLRLTDIRVDDPHRRAHYGPWECHYRTATHGNFVSAFAIAAQGVVDN
ncbi:MAG: hypothetical protein HYV02_08005 [Deltaproteobacteria bacterium]|nr:hypothetical protein [Deltaproteobacteria bacterium]